VFVLWYNVLKLISWQTIFRNVIKLLTDSFVFHNRTPEEKSGTPKACLFMKNLRLQTSPKQKSIPIFSKEKRKASHWKAFM
jgi:hypothetical protein